MPKKPEPLFQPRPQFPLSETVFRLEDAAAYLDLSRSGIYRLVKFGKLKAFKIGGATRIHGAELKRLVDTLAGIAQRARGQRVRTRSLRRNQKVNRAPHKGE